MIHLIKLGLLLGFILAVPAGLTVFLTPLPHLSPGVLPKGSEYYCFVLCALLLFLWLFIRGRLGDKRFSGNNRTRDVALVFLTAIISGLIMIRAVFFLAFLALIFVTKLTK